MKIIKDKAVTQERMEKFVSRIMGDAKFAAEQGRDTFHINVGRDELNGIDIEDLRRLLELELEGTVQLSRELSVDSSFAYFKIVEL